MHACMHACMHAMCCAVLCCACAVLCMRARVCANNPDLLEEYSRSLQLTEGWARNVLKSMNWTKRKGTTGKVDPSDQFLLEEKLTFQRNIAEAMHEHDIPEDLVVNLDQTPLHSFFLSIIRVNSFKI